ncbi:MAG TPA: class IV adenylate cyclase [Tepidisphaeraceae bacterium]|nr:class IV adenylate cyclase [Tepidisphaeraceae bacterium]
MPTEIEAKMKVENLEPTRQRLRDRGAEQLSKAFETNIFFDTEKRELLAQDKSLRVRHERDERDGAEKVKITFKGPQLKGELKSRDERELKVENLGDALALFEGLGYRRTLTFQKRRESWKLEDCQIELDELPNIGTFVEIEGPNEQAVMQMRTLLELDQMPLIRRGYTALLTEDLKKRNINSGVITFK